MKASTVVFGIDLGTTNSLITLVAEDSLRLLEVAGETLLPSVVRYVEGGVVEAVGVPARNGRLLAPERTVSSIKSHMGVEGATVEVSGTALTPVRVSSDILAALAKVARANVAEGPLRAVITVPAQFGDAARRATRDAAEFAGFEVLRLVNEPTAAALAFFEAGESRSDEEKVLVFDLGGGTFDTSVVERHGTHCEVLASEGDRRLGGDDFDSRLADLVFARVEGIDSLGPRESALFRARLEVLCEEAKKGLSASTSMRISDPVAKASFGVALDVVVDRPAFEEAIEDLVARTVELSRLSLQRAGVAPHHLSRILLVGGSTRVPLVRRLLEEAFPGVELDLRVDPDLAVALGAGRNAAMAAGLELERALVDVAPASLGVAVVGVELFDRLLSGEIAFEEEREESAYITENETFSPIVRKNSPIPSRAVEIYYTSTPWQEKIHFRVGQGEARLFKDVELIGDFMFPLRKVSEREAAALGGQRAVECALSYTSDGLVRVQARELPDGKPMEVMFTAGRARLEHTATPSATDRSGAVIGGAPENALLRKARAHLAANAFASEQERHAFAERVASYEQALRSPDGVEARELDAVEDALLDALETAP